MEQNEKLQNALSDISVIKQTMGKSRMQTRRLSSVFFLYGGIQFVLVAACWIVNFLCRGIEIPLYGFLWVMNLSYLAIAVFYFVWRRELKQTDNNYTLYAYDLWGYALFVIPLIWILTFVLNLLFPNFITEGTVLSIIALYWVAEQLMFFIAMAATGFLLNCEDWKILSVIFLLAYFLSFAWVSGLPESLADVQVSTVLGEWLSIAAFWGMICPLIAIVMGIYFRPKKSLRF